MEDETYESLSFEALLQEGRISEAIQLRIEQLMDNAHDARLELEAAKFINGGAIAVGAILGMGNPLALLFASIGGGLYAAAVFQDWLKSRKLCPLPMVRSNLLQSIGRMTNGEQQPINPLADVMDYIEPLASAEYMLLMQKEDEMVSYLLNRRFQPYQRLAAYRFALRRAYQTNIPHLPAIDHAVSAIAIPAPAPTAALPAAADSNGALPESQPDTPAATARSDSVGTDGAAAVPTTAIQPAAAENPHPSPVSYLIGSRLRTSLIVSVSGGGKDVLLSNAIRVFLPAHPGFQVVVMDCKDDPKEYGYYADLPNVTVHRLNVAIASDGEVVEWVDRCLEQFLHLPEQALLVCNEGTLIRKLSKRYIAAVDGLVSSGDSREKYCWEAGQSAHTDDLGINGAARSRFRLLIIGMKGEEMQIEAVLQAKFVADTARNMEDIKGQMVRSAVGRAWCDGQRWFPMPQLENYSSWNRDQRQAIGQPAPAASPTPSPAPSPSPAPAADVRSRLENLYHGEPAAEPDAVAPNNEALEKLSRYLQSKGKIDLRTVDKNWGRNNGFQGEALKDLLTQLESQGSIALWGDGIIWKG